MFTTFGKYVVVASAHQESNTKQTVCENYFFVDTVTLLKWNVWYLAPGDIIVTGKDQKLKEN